MIDIYFNQTVSTSQHLTIYGGKGVNFSVVVSVHDDEYMVRFPREGILLPVHLPIDSFTQNPSHQTSNEDFENIFKVFYDGL